jgi:cysteine synthase
MSWYKNITQTVGETPLVQLNSLPTGEDAVILAKLEFFNPTSSIKDRIAISMIDAAEREGKLKPGGIIVEPTSGNTGLGLAMVAAARNYRLIITMPEGMSIERRSLMQYLGAEIIMTPDNLGMSGAIQKAEEILKENPNSFMPQQFKNPANIQAHTEHTGPEIWDATDGHVDAFVAGVGTGGTLIGVGQYLKSCNPHVKIIAMEPESSSVLSGCAPGRHGIQGIGAGFIPEIMDVSLVDDIITVSDEEACAMSRKIATEEGILCGISSGANAVAAVKVAARMGGNIVTVFPDTGERYLSTGLFLS